MNITNEEKEKENSRSRNIKIYMTQEQADHFNNLIKEEIERQQARDKFDESLKEAYKLNGKKL